jgi:hypothetical protein
VSSVASEGMGTRGSVGLVIHWTVMGEAEAGAHQRVRGAASVANKSAAIRSMGFCGEHGLSYARAYLPKDGGRSVMFRTAAPSRQRSRDPGSHPR